MRIIDGESMSRKSSAAAHGDLSPDTEFGQKGVGEGRAIGAAVATANAVNRGAHAPNSGACGS